MPYKSEIKREEFDQYEINSKGKYLNFFLESFSPLRKVPIDDRMTFDFFSDFVTLDSDVNFSGEPVLDKFNDLLYDGCITYMKSTDTYLMKNGETLIPIISRFKFMNVKQMLSSLMVPIKDYATSLDTYILKPLSLDDIPSCYKYFTNTHFKFLNIACNNDSNNEGDNNVKGNSLDVFNQYMRGTDCIIDLDNNIYISKEYKVMDDEYNHKSINRRFIAFKFGRIFNTDNNIIKKIAKVIDSAKDTSNIIDSLHDTVKQLATVVNSIKPESFTSDQSTVISGINDSLTTIKTSIESLKTKTDINMVPVDLTGVQYRNNPVPTPEKYTNIESKINIKHKRDYETPIPVGEDEHL